MPSITLDYGKTFWWRNDMQKKCENIVGLLLFFKLDSGRGQATLEVMMWKLW